jgi:hypothetical protein
MKSLYPLVVAVCHNLKRRKEHQVWCVGENLCNAPRESEEETLHGYVLTKEKMFYNSMRHQSEENVVLIVVVVC